MREILDFLNELIISLDDNINATVKWRIPYYVKNRPLVYLNIPKHTHRVEMNFLQTKAFSQEVRSLLDYGDRKTIAGLSFYKLEDIDEELLELVLEEALKVDRLLSK